MARELYKMIHKKYYIAVLLLLLLPALFGVGYFFDLPYMMEGDEIAGSALDYCSKMQQLIKYFYFLVVIFLSCDAFSGEIEGGQLRTLMVHVSSRKKIMLQKYVSLCIMALICHLLFWTFNSIIYCICSIKNGSPVILADKDIRIYAGIFAGYLVAFFVCMAIAFLAGVFLKKLYCLILVYFIWFALRYADQVAGLKGISTEFLADYLSGASNSGATAVVLCYVFSLLLCVIAIYSSICVYRHKDIS